ncbi:MAG: hypothetical protein CMF46_04415 [Legionellales bacterium]|nr:hypothetical protein [Legionellales bacterium]|tara:strand:- start:112 stop:1149 length:1038 start_codon:yes stop_codon:yes gene_type:complete
MVKLDFNKPIVIKNRKLDSHNQALCKEFSEKGDLFNQLGLIPNYFARKIFTRACRQVMQCDQSLDSIETIDETLHHKKIRRYNVNKTATKKVLLYFHGGSFVYGSIDSHDGICRTIARETDINTICFDYSLSPENKFPHALNDSLAVYDHIMETNNLSEEDIIFIGESAGANLAISLCIKLNQIHRKQPSKLILIVPPSGQLHHFGSDSSIAYSNGPSRLDIEACRRYTNLYIGDNDWNNPLIFPILQQDYSFIADTLIVTAGFDVLRDDGIALFHKIKNTKKHTYHLCFDTLTHEFLFLHHHIPVVNELFKLLRVFCRDDYRSSITNVMSDINNNLILYELSES